MGTYRRRDRDTVAHTMRRVRSTETKPEVVLRKALWALGYRYRKNVADLPGKPDIVFWSRLVAVFVDGDFWHGNQWRLRGLSSLAQQFEGSPSREYWLDKIARNMERDRIVTAALQADGWEVVRVWEHEVNRDIDGCVERIINALRVSPNAPGSEG